MVFLASGEWFAVVLTTANLQFDIDESSYITGQRIHVDNGLSNIMAVEKVQFDVGVAKNRGTKLRNKL